MISGGLPAGPRPSTGPSYRQPLAPPDAWATVGYIGRPSDPLATLESPPSSSFGELACFIYFLDQRYATFELWINVIEINYGKSWTNVSQDPIILDDLALPFGFDLEALPIKEKYCGGYNVSMAGILIRIERESFGMLLSGYCYPTVSFALLSMVSFLIHPDMVRQAKIFSLTLSRMISIL